MKRFTSVILILLYFTASTGAPISAHYCMGKLADWRLGHEPSKICGNCGMTNAKEAREGCCKDEHSFFKNDSDQKTTEASIQLGYTDEATLPSYFQLPAVAVSFHPGQIPVSNAPPRSCNLHIYILNRAILI